MVGVAADLALVQRIHEYLWDWPPRGVERGTGKDLRVDDFPCWTLRKMLTLECRAPHRAAKLYRRLHDGTWFKLSDYDAGTWFAVTQVRTQVA